MATYLEYNGANIPIRSSDPTNPVAGEIWYNTSTRTLKGHLYAPGTWASGNPMVGTPIRASQSTGSATSAVCNGGVTSTAHVNQTEEWNGTSWSAGNTSSTSGYSRCGFGIQTAAVFLGGQNGPSTVYNVIEEYDGTNWTTSPGTLAQPTRSARGTGTQTAGIFASGSDGDPPVKLNQSYTYNGTCVTATNSVPAARDNAMAGGTSQTSMLLYGGDNSGVQSNTYSWDGTNWTAVNSLNTADAYGAGTFSSSTSTLKVGTTWPSVSPTEQWDGTCWSTITGLTENRQNGVGSGTGTSAFVAGGYDNPNPTQNSNKTELWTGAGPATVTITTS